jgi:hypothetical protein
MAVFDIDDYIESIDQRDKIKKIKLNHIKVPPIKFDRVIQIKVFVKDIIDKFIDWDLEDDQIRPIDIAKELAEEAAIDEKYIPKISDAIIKEISAYIDENVAKQAYIAKKKVTSSSIACPE